MYGITRDTRQAGYTWWMRVMLALLMVATSFGLFVALPQRAYAENRTVAIAQGDSVGSVQTKIQNAINASSAGDTVTVTGSRTGVTEQLTLNMKQNVTVAWKAQYAGPVKNNHIDQDVLLCLNGEEGIFEVAENGSLANEGNTAAITAAGYALRVKVNGGTVTAVYSWAICATGPKVAVEVNSGKVSSTCAIIISGELSSITVNGGTVEAAGDMCLYSPGSNSTIYINGGTVSNTVGWAIYYKNSDTAVTISGGFVFAYGDISSSYEAVIGISSIGSPQIKNSAVVCAWKQAAGKTSYDVGSSEHLTFSGATTIDSKPRWDIKDGVSGIMYPIGAYAGFFPVNGVTVNPFVVSFNTGGGSAVPTQYLAYGGTVTEPASPTRAGYAFDGWYLDQALTTKYRFGANTYESFTLYAKWTANAASPAPTSPQPTSPQPTGPQAGGSSSVGTSQGTTGGAGSQASGSAGAANDNTLLIVALVALVAAAAGGGVAYVVIRRKDRKHDVPKADE